MQDGLSIRLLLNRSATGGSVLSLNEFSRSSITGGFSSLSKSGASRSEEVGTASRG